mgnify:CR=1 FL=1
MKWLFEESRGQIPFLSEQIFFLPEFDIHEFILIFLFLWSINESIFKLRAIFNTERGEVVSTFLTLHQVDQGVFQILRVKGEWVQRVCTMSCLVFLDCLLHFLLKLNVYFLAIVYEFRMLCNFVRHLFVEARNLWYLLSCFSWFLYIFDLNLFFLLLMLLECNSCRLSSLKFFIDLNVIFSNPRCRFTLPII